MKNIQKFLIALIAFVSLQTLSAQEATSKSTTVKINGNCGMCKKTIEKAANQNTAVLDWNSDSKTATLTYNPNKTNVNEVLKRVAAAGYDNEKFRADDAVYEKLHGCCQYTRETTSSK